MSMEKTTETSGFLDGRKYTAAFLYEFFALLVGNGVYAGELAPTATNENMTITHGSGHAWINGVCYKNKTPFVLDIATADGSLNRYDSLMLRLDLSINETYAIIVQGDFAAEPTPPTVTRNAETYDLKICDIYVPAGCTKITQELITDTRLDSSVCGVPVFPVEHLDMTTFYQQIAADLASFRGNTQSEYLALIEQLRAELQSAKDETIYALKEEVTDMAVAAVTLSAAGWSGNAQTVAVAGVLADGEKQAVITTAAAGSLEVYLDCGVVCSGQGDGTLTFTCSDTPTADITVNVLMLTKGVTTG